MVDIAKKLAEFNKKGLEETSSGGSFEKSLLKITDVDTDVSGSKSTYDNLKKIKTEMAFIIFTIKVGNGQYKGQEFKWHTLLLNSNGDMNIYPSYIKKDGTEVLASELYEIVHAIKEHDKEQWDDSLINAKKFIGKKFEFEIGDLGSGMKMNTSRNKKSYEDWKAKNGKGESQTANDSDIDEDAIDEF